MVRRLNGLSFETTVEFLAVLGAFATIPLTVVEWNHETMLTDLLDTLIWVVFVVETVVLWRRARRDGAGWSWVGLSVFVCVVSCPAWFYIFRNFEDLASLSRLLRIVRLVRLGGVGVIGFPALRRIVRPGLIYVAGLTALIIVVSAGVFTIVEPEVHHNYFSGLWLATVTAATVGYGDIAPRTALGRVTAIALMIAGIGLLSTLSASIAAAFVGQEDAAEERATRHRIERMEDLLRASGSGDLGRRMDRMEALLEELARQNGITAPPRAEATSGAQENGSTS